MKGRTKQQRRTTKTKKTSNKMLINVNIYLSIITLKVRGLNPLIKRHGVAYWIKTRPIYMLLAKQANKQKTPHFRTKGTHRLRKKMFHANGK